MSKMQHTERIEVIGIPTRDRPEVLARCLGDLAESARAHGRRFEVLVADDSTRPDALAANRDLVRTMRPEFPGRLHHVGPDERARFGDDLVRAGLEPETVRFALQGGDASAIATGANRNLLTLLAAGRLLLQVDDDTLSRTAAIPGATATPDFSPRYDPTEFWFPSADTFAPLGPPANLAGLHESLLGRAAGVGRVRVTTAGVAGDSGMSSPVYFLMLQGASRVRLHGTEATYREALAGGRVVRGVTRPTVCGGSVCLGLNLGLDLRTPLVPFPPTGRNQDGAFAAVVRACVPGAFFGHPPAAVWHLPVPPRSFPADVLDRAADGPKDDHLLLALVRAHAPRQPDADARRNLRHLGDTLAELGALPPEEFAEVLENHANEWKAGLTAQLDGMLQSFGGPPWWAADVARLLGRLRSVTAGCHFTPAAERVTRLRQSVGGYGRLLAQWPDLADAAQRLSPLSQAVHKLA